MKKLCYVTTVASTVKAFLLPALAYLREHTDWELTVICSGDPELEKLLPEGVRYIPVKMERGISLGGLAACRRMYRIFRKEKFDLVQYSTPNASLYASLAAWLAGVRVRLYCQWGMAFVGFSGMKRRLFRAIEKLVCSLSTRVCPDSFGNLRFCHAEGLYGPEKSGVIWNGSASGVNLEKFDITKKQLWREAVRQKLGIPAEAAVLTFVGRITGDKGTNELFTACKALLAQREDVHLLLVGRAEKADSVEDALYRWAEQEPRVHFCGFTNVVEQYMAASDVYVLPSYREGFGSAVIEAEAMGLPVIVTDIPGPTDAMERDVTGLVVPVKDAAALKEAMEALTCDPARRAEMGKAGYAFAKEKFDQRVLMEKILEDRKVLLR